MVEYVVIKCDSDTDDVFCNYHLISRSEEFGNYYLGSWFTEPEAQDAADTLTARQARRLQEEANRTD